MVSDLINNLALILAFSVFYSILTRSSLIGNLIGDVVYGFLFGGMCIVVMNAPMTLAPGVITDTRTVVLSLAGLFGGPVAAVISTASASVYRIWLGGQGVLAGVVGMVLGALAGCIFRQIIKGKTGDLTPWKLYLFGLMAEAAHLLSAFTLPSNLTWKILEEVTLPFMAVVPVGILILGVLLSDIHSRMDSVKALRKSEQRFLDTLNNAPSAIYFKDTSYKYLLVNNVFLKMTGISNKDVRGLSDYDIWPHDVAQAFYQNDQQVFSSGKALDVIENVRLKNGDVKHYRSTKFPLFDDKGELYSLCGISNDITRQLEEEQKRRTLETQLIQSQKMEAIGTLAGGIAHDFNNILSAIIGYAELIQMNLSKDQDTGTQTMIKEILKAGIRARDLVRQILTFSRKTEEERNPVEVDLIIDEALKLLRATLPANIEIEKQLDSKAVIMADPTQIHQVVMNLCTNADHAMRENGGVLRVELTEVEVDPSTAAMHIDMEPGIYLNLLISDNGKGMKPEVLERIFEPFYTTKEQGEGTGMGLSLVHGIVTSLGGMIHAYSELGVGSTFSIYLPVLQSDLETIDEKTDLTMYRGDETILVVDDEESITKLISELLPKLGYRVETKNDSQEALAYFQENPQKFDLVVADVTMPVMTGDKLAQQMLRIRQDIPIILATGFSTRVSDQSAQELGIRAILTKPFIINQLSAAIRQALDSA